MTFDLTFDRHKSRRIVAAAIVAVVLVLPPPVLAQTASDAPTPPPAVSQTAPDAVAPSVAAPASGPAAGSPEIALKLPRDLSPWGMFMAADIVVKPMRLRIRLGSAQMPLADMGTIIPARLQDFGERLVLSRQGIEAHGFEQWRRWKRRLRNARKVRCRRGSFQLPPSGA